MLTARLASDSPSDQTYRAGTYALLAALLRAPPDADLYARLLQIDSDLDGAVSDPLGAAWAALRDAAQAVGEARRHDAVDDEFHQLFIGIGRGELVPFGSWYQTGFLMEKPLSALRDDLAALGFERQQGVREPEDHIAALCEVMALLIDDAETSASVQRTFFDTHVASWSETFFRDLETARAADFYRHVGRLGKAFVELEKRYMAMPV